MTFHCRARARSEFFSCDVVFQGSNASKIHLFICCFEQVGINAEKFEKTRFFKLFKLRLFVLIVTHLLPARHQYFKAPYIHERDTLILVLQQTLMIEGGKYHDSLEELFTLQNIVERYSLSISDLKSPET